MRVSIARRSVVHIGGGNMGYIITGILVIAAFMTSAATFSAFLFYAIGEAATRADEGMFAPASYQPMEMLTGHATPAADAADATQTVHVPAAA